MPIPTVGTSGLNLAQLSPRARRILKRRAQAAAQREYAPVLAADRSAIGGVNRDFRNEKQSIRGATNMAQASLDQALRGLKSSGLSGRYLKQAVSELGARSGDVAQSVPFLLSDAAKERGDALHEARSQLITDRAEMQQGAASKFNSLLESQRSKASTVLKERKEKESQFDPRKLQNASLALEDALTAWKKNVLVDVNGEEIPVQQLNPLKTMTDFRAFAKGLVDEYDGFDFVDVMEVIKQRLRGRRKVAAGPYRSQSSKSAIRSQATEEEHALLPVP